MSLLRGADRSEASPSRRRRFGAPPAGGVSSRHDAPFGWSPLAILVAVGIVDAMESRIVGGALPLIQEEFGIGDAVAGAIPTAVTIAGAIVTLPAGWLADRYNRTNLMALVVLSWAFLLLGSAVAPTFAVFFAVRVVLGAADSIDNPASGSLLGDFYPPLTRAKAFGWARLTTYAGGAVGTVYAGIVSGLLGWRWAYAFMIVPGLACAWLVWRLREPVRGFMDRVAATAEQEPLEVPDSPDDRPVSAVAKLREVADGADRAITGRAGLATLGGALATVLATGAGVAAGRGVGVPALGLVAGLLVAAGAVVRRERLLALVAPVARRPRPLDEATMAAHERLKQQLDFRQQLGYVLRVPTLRLITLGLMAMSFGLGGVVFWVPTLMVRSFDVPVEVAGPVAGLVSLVGLVGGTWYGGRLGRRWHGTRRGGRLLAGGSGLLVGSLLLGAAIAQPTLGLFALVLLVATGLMALAIPNLMASVADVLLATSRGLGFSLLQFLVAGAGAFSPTIVGAISDATGSLAVGMYALVVPGALGGVLVLMARRHFDRDAGLVLEAARGDTGP